MTAFLNHVYILSGNDAKVQDILLQWVAHMFQYPEYKSFVPVLISEEGAGKGTFFAWMRALMGTHKVFETGEPLKYVFG